MCAWCPRRCRMWRMLTVFEALFGRFRFRGERLAPRGDDLQPQLRWRASWTQPTSCELAPSVELLRGITYDIGVRNLNSVGWRDYGGSALMDSLGAEGGCWCRWRQQRQKSEDKPAHSEYGNWSLPATTRLEGLLNHKMWYNGNTALGEKEDR